MSEGLASVTPAALSSSCLDHGCAIVQRSGRLNIMRTGRQHNLPNHTAVSRAVLTSALQLASVGMSAGAGEVGTAGVNGEVPGRSTSANDTGFENTVSGLGTFADVDQEGVAAAEEARLVLYVCGTPAAVGVMLGLWREESGGDACGAAGGPTVCLSKTTMNVIPLPEGVLQGRALAQAMSTAVAACAAGRGGLRGR